MHKTEPLFFIGDTVKMLKPVTIRVANEPHAAKITIPAGFTGEVMDDGVPRMNGGHVHGVEFHIPLGPFGPGPIPFQVVVITISESCVDEEDLEKVEDQ